MGIVEAIKKGFAFSRKFMAVIIIFFILNTIVGLVSLPLAGPGRAGKPGTILISLAITAIFFVIFIFLQGGSLGLARDAHKKGDIDMANFAVYGKKYYVKILCLLLFYILIALAIVLILGLIGSGILALANNGFTKAFVGAIAAGAAFFAIVLLLFPIYSIVADESGVVDALKKGIAISRENFWNVAGLFLSLVVISLLVSLIVGFIAGLITVPLPFKVTQIIITLVNAAVQSYIPIVMMLALMGYYLGLTGKEPAKSIGGASLSA